MALALMLTDSLVARALTVVERRGSCYEAREEAESVALPIRAGQWTTERLLLMCGPDATGRVRSRTGLKRIRPEGAGSRDRFGMQRATCRQVSAAWAVACRSLGPLPPSMLVPCLAWGQARAGIESFGSLDQGFEVFRW
jgi:hypothetical protein